MEVVYCMVGKGEQKIVNGQNVIEFCKAEAPVFLAMDITWIWLDWSFGMF